MSVNAAAELAEKRAFAKIKKILGLKDSDVFAAPAGSEASFPDFGYSVTIDGKRIDLFFEYKLDHKAQMGSMRNWIFSGGKFTVPAKDADDENKKLLLEIMNSTSSAKTQARRLLTDFKKYFDKGITEISSGMLAIVTDKLKRKMKIQKFIQNTENYQIANIEDTRLGSKISDHYHKKFLKNQQPGADGAMMFMMMGDTIWYMESKDVSSKYEKAVFKMLGSNADIPTLPALQAKLECRIQPRHTDVANAKPAHIDVLAVFRLARRPAGGYSI